MRKQRDAEVFLITGARQGLADDVRGRQRRYVISMLIRTVSVLLTVLLWNVQRPLAVVTLVVGALLPYVAVVVANAGRETPPSLPSAFTDASARPELNSAESVAEAPRTRPDGSMADRS
jgi:membrane protein required for beta-lactamase induction